jgi:hypothetical protein
MPYVSWVSSGAGEQAATAAQVVLATAPADDAGASTADRYDWQAAMAAADGLALYLDALSEGKLRADADGRIVCEHHEDWVVVRGDDAELVSAKHREPGYSVFTTTGQLAGDGGLAHLFGRWHTLGERPSCRLVTTAGLAPGPAQGLEKAAAYLRDLRRSGQDLLPADGDHEPAISGFARALRLHPGDLPSPWQATTGDGAEAARDQAGQVCRFLAGLCIQHGKPSRAHVGHAAPTMYCAPVLDRLGHDDPALAVAVWEAVHGLFRTRMRAAGPTPQGALPAVLAYQPGTLPPGTVGERELAARIVTVADIDVAVRAALAHPRGFLPLPPAPRVTRLAVKMAAGCCTDNSIERAEQLRLDHQRYWRARVSGDPAARTSQQRLRRELLRISDQATAAVSPVPGAAWGADLWRELQARVEVMPGGGWPEDLDPGLRLGGICDLSNRCKVWFSDRFDVDAAIAQLRALQEVAP